MIWIGALLSAGLIVSSRKWWRSNRKREWFVQCGLLVCGLVIISMIEWRVHMLFDPLQWVTVVFEPVTKWIYQTL